MDEEVSYTRLYAAEEHPQLQNVNISEFLRYAGIKKTPVQKEGDAVLTDAVEEAAGECIREAMPLLSYKVSYRRFPINIGEDEFSMPFDIMGSKDILKNLSGCDEVVIFAATIGVGIDRLIRKYNHLSPSKALLMQALGAERIEALCDLFNSEIEAEASLCGKRLKPRYSPGYGDLPLEVQRSFFSLLDCTRRIGVTLNESLLMSPSKSVTAIIGIRPADGGDYDVKEAVPEETRSKCEKCENRECVYRET